MDSPKVSVEFHDGVLQSIALNWQLATCVAWVALYQGWNSHPYGRIEWSGVERLSIEHTSPWGPSESILEVHFDGPDGDELHMQSGDVIRVRATARQVDVASETLGAKYAVLGTDALVDAGLVAREQAEATIGVLATEIDVRRSMGDV